MKITLIAAALLFTAASPVTAQVIDGTLDASYGAADSLAQTNPAAPTSNFGAPTDQVTAGYSFFVNSGPTDVSFFIQQLGGESAGSFSNLYFDLDAATRSGSDLAFEISAGGVNAFIPGVGGSVAIDSSLFSFASVTVNGLTNLEFSLDNSLFNSAIAGLGYNPAVTFSGQNRVNLSQTLGYSVAGGAAFYGNDRLGLFSTASATAAVPEPATWAMMLMGFGAMGVALRRSRRKSALLQVA